LIDRGDIAAMSKFAAEVTGIPTLHELEGDLFEDTEKERGIEMAISG